MKVRIIVADNEEIFATGVKMGLLAEGYAVDLVSDGEQALRRILMNKDVYDLIILEMVLPAVSGVAICKALRDRGISAPVLFLSSKADIDDKVAAFDAGADDYLTKPFSFKELSVRIQALLRRPATVIGNELMVGNMVLNCQTHKVCINDKEIALSLKEFRVLEYLMRNPDQVVPRDRLLEHVWDFSFSSFSNVVDVHINGIRRKLRLAKTGVLETVRGVGYRVKTTARHVSRISKIKIKIRLPRRRRKKTTIPLE
jgi:DNA-binding response OmpR family regulator